MSGRPNWHFRSLNRQIRDLSARSAGEAVSAAGISVDFVGKEARRRKLTRQRRVSLKAPDELWSDRRAGARKVAGVRYQVRLTVALLVRAAHGGFPATALMPEGPVLRPDQQG